MNRVSVRNANNPMPTGHGEAGPLRIQYVIQQIILVFEVRTWRLRSKHMVWTLGYPSKSIHLQDYLRGGVSIN